MLTPDVINLFVGIMLLLTTLWAANEFLLLAEGIVGRPRKKHRNGVDVGQYEVELIGFDIGGEVLLPKELAVVTNYMSADISEILMLNDERRF